MNTVLVSCLGAPGGPPVVDCLDRAGFRVVMVDIRPDAPGFYVCNPDFPRYVVPLGIDLEYVPRLLDICRQEEVDSIILGSDEEVWAVSRRLDEFLALGVKPTVSPYEVVARAEDKAATMAAARETGVPHPAFFTDLAGADPVAPPYVLKPRRGRGGQGVTRVDTREALAPAWETVARDFGPPLGMEYVPYAPGNIYMFVFATDRQGRVKMRFGSRSFRTKFDFGGPATAGVVAMDPVGLDHAQRLVEATGPWVGLVCVEFLRHAGTGEFKLLEINPRINGYNSLSTAAGYAFPEVAVKLMLDLPLPPLPEAPRDVVLVRGTREVLRDRADFVAGLGRGERAELLTRLEEPGEA